MISLFISRIHSQLTLLITMKLVFLMVAMGTPASSMALTIDEAISLAIANNPQIDRSQAGVLEADANRGLATSSYYPRVDASYSYLQSDQLAFGSTDKLSTLRLTASYNLFNGFADFNRSVAASHRSRAAELQFKAVTADIVLETRRAFIESLRARHRVATAQEGVELLNLQKRDASLNLAQGMIARNDLLRIEVELSQARQGLLQAEGALRIADRSLERVIGKSIQGEEPVEIELIVDPPLLDKKMQIDYQSQLNNRSEILYLKEFLEAAKSDKGASRAGYLPRVDLAMTHEKYGDSASPTGRDASYDEDTIVSVTASWNLFNGLASRKSIAATDAKQAAVNAQLRDTYSQLLLQLQSALEDDQIAKGRVAEAAIGVTQAEENYRITSNRRTQQLATTVDLLDASFLLTRARNLETDARYDLLLSRAKLDRVLER